MHISDNYCRKNKLNCTYMDHNIKLLATVQAPPGTLLIYTLGTHEPVYISISFGITLSFTKHPISHSDTQ